MTLKKALFLDRDGVINQRIVGRYVRTIDEFQLIDGVLPILHLARSRGYLLVMISNQQGVGKGLMTMSELDAIHSHMQSVIAKELGRGLDDLRVCTDLATANSSRRKPAPGMLLEAVHDLRLDPDACWFLGDAITDAQAGQAAGIHTALIGNFPPRMAEIIATSHDGILAKLGLKLTVSHTK